MQQSRVVEEHSYSLKILKPMLHALLIPNTLTFLSVASNRRLKGPAFRLIGAYVTKARSLQFLDLSQNTLDKKAIEYIAAALPEAPSSSGLISLRLDDCALKPQALDVLGESVSAIFRSVLTSHQRMPYGNLRYETYLYDITALVRLALWPSLL